MHKEVEGTLMGFHLAQSIQYVSRSDFRGSSTSPAACPASPTVGKISARLNGQDAEQEGGRSKE